MSESFVQAGVLIWVVLGLTTGWLKETGLRLLSLHDGSIDFPADATSDFGRFGSVRQQPPRI
jgi:hypothetical protein